MALLLWPFTELVVEEIRALGITPPRIDGHDAGDEHGVDFIFGEVTPHLCLSEGEYMQIDQEQGLYSYTFGMRGCSGGDPTYGGDICFEPSAAKAKELALAYQCNFKFE